MFSSAPRKTRGQKVDAACEIRGKGIGQMLRGGEGQNLRGYDGGGEAGIKNWEGAVGLVWGRLWVNIPKEREALRGKYRASRAETRNG